ncbi:MAG: twin-arginine translocase TatA/TatE family subunit [Bacteroidales bacterium]|nr:twin-arginine translocase TatA/TatE family subunit [Bacteroidales bacterium]MBD5387208.1 twin-arginine translocase TatA/TatE family subunit [bacterium]
MILCLIGATEIILISAVILLIFGGKKLPELMKGMGKGLKSFKEGMNEPSEEEMNRRVEEEIKRRADSQVNATAPQHNAEDERAG